MWAQSCENSSIALCTSKIMSSPVGFSAGWNSWIREWSIIEEKTKINVVLKRLDVCDTFAKWWSVEFLLSLRIRQAKFPSLKLTTRFSGLTSPATPPPCLYGLICICGPLYSVSVLSSRLILLEYMQGWTFYFRIFGQW